MSVLTSKSNDLAGGAGTPLPNAPVVVAERDWFTEKPVPPVASRAAAANPMRSQPLQGGDCLDDDEDPAYGPILDGLLRMADAYRGTGSLRQAVEMYFALAHRHAGTPQAAGAVNRLLDIARGYEDAGELRQARGIYEHLLRT